MATGDVSRRRNSGKIGLATRKEKVGMATRKTKRASSLVLGRKATLQRGRTEFIKDEVNFEEEYKNLDTAVHSHLRIEETGSPEVINTSPPRYEKSEEDDPAEGYDTDLEDTTEPVVDKEDKYGRLVYEKTCARLRVKPISSVQGALHLQEINLSHRGLRLFETLALCNALLENGTVNVLRLDGNSLGFKGAQYVASLLTDNRRIHSVSMSDNYVGSTGAQVITDMLLINNTLKSLNVSGNEFNDDDGVLFAQVLTTNKTLRHLNLSHNKFSDYAAKFLGPALGVNETVRSLNLSWNQIRPMGGYAISRGVLGNVTLRSLNLSMNGFSTRGTMAMAEALKKNSTLQDLDMSYNRIYDDSATKLAKAFNKNESIRRLHLAHNPLTTATARAFLEVFISNVGCQLDVLDMSTVPLYKDVVPLLSQLRERRPSFIFLYAGIVQSSTEHFKEAGESMIHEDPMIIMLEFMAKKGLRLLEFFKQFDKDGGGSIDRDEFLNGLKLMEIPLTAAQLDELMKKLDKDGDGEVDYGEMIQGEKEYRKIMQRRRRKYRKRIEEERERRQKFLEGDPTLDR